MVLLVAVLPTDLEGDVVLKIVDRREESVRVGDEVDRGLKKDSKWYQNGHDIEIVHRARRMKKTKD